jgi:hypothetical protein
VQLLVTWDAPSTGLTIFGGDGGLPIDYYVLEFNENNFVPNPPFSVIPSETHTDLTSLRHVIGFRSVVDGVEADTLLDLHTYVVRVYAHNNLGVGPALLGVPTPSNMLDVAPSVPRTVAVAPVGASPSSLAVTWALPEFDGGRTLTAFDVNWDTTPGMASGSFGTARSHVLHEMQRVDIAESPVVRELQAIQTTVDVTNEVKVFTTTVAGVDEVQLVTTSLPAAVVAEQQTITTYTEDFNEVQVIYTTGTDQNEVQTVRTDMPVSGVNS